MRLALGAHAKFHDPRTTPSGRIGMLQAGGGRRGNQQVRTGAGNNPYFQGLTAQQNLLGAIEQQLQQAVARAIMQALSGAAPVWGTGVGNVPPSS